MSGAQSMINTALLNLVSLSNTEVATFGNTLSNAQIRMYDSNTPTGASSTAYMMGLTNGAFTVVKEQGDTKVGLGTTNPAAMTHIVNPSSTLDSFRVDDASGGDTSPFVIDKDGNVGVGLAAPTVKLDVSGAIKASGQITSTLANGTAPFSVTSSTVVTNLNADKLDGQDGTYYNDPANLSSAVSVAKGGTGQTSLTANKVVVGNGTNGVLTPSDLHWDNTNSFLGISTTSPDVNLHLHKSAANGTQALIHNPHNGTNSHANLLLRNDTSSYACFFLNSSGRTGDGGANTATVRNDVGDLRLQAKGALGMHVKADTGSVGIGTTNPSTKLHVHSTSTSDGILTKRYYLDAPGDNVDTSGDNNEGAPWYGLGLCSETGLTTQVVPQLTGYYGVAMKTRSGLMVMDTGGMVGIGTTNPQKQLHVNGDIRTDGSLFVSGVTDKWLKASDGTLIWSTHEWAGSHSFEIFEQNTSQTRVHLDTNGKSYLVGGAVGIGTTDPQSELHVKGSLALGNKLERYTDGYSKDFQVFIPDAYVNGGNSGAIYYGGAMWVKAASMRSEGWNYDGYAGDLNLFAGNYSSVNNNGTAWEKGYGGNVVIKAGYANMPNTNGSAASPYPGSIAFYTADNGYNVGSHVERLRINPGGYVGIGLTNPGAKLHVKGGDYSTTADVIVQNETNCGTGVGGSLTFKAKYGTSEDLFYMGRIGAVRENSLANYSSRLAFSIGETGLTEAMSVSSAGRVGIGITNPTYPLVVNGYTNSGNLPAAGKYYAGVDVYNFTTSDSANVGLRVPQVAWCGGFLTTSDRRIKTNIQDVNDQDALEKLRLLKPKTYEYIDKVARGTETVYGFIAQDVKEVLPYGVSKASEFIPSVFKIGKLTILGDKKFNVELEDAIPDIVTGDYVRFITDANADVDVQVVKEDDFTLAFETDIDITGERLFVYGKKVDDFNVLDKDAVFTIGIAAMQDLDRQVQSLKNELASLKDALRAEGISV